MIYVDEEHPNRFYVSDSAKQESMGFGKLDEALRCAELVIAQRTPAVLRDHYSRAIHEQTLVDVGGSIVSEKAVGRLFFLRAMAAVFAPSVRITLLRWDESDDARR